MPPSFDPNAKKGPGGPNAGRITGEKPKDMKTTLKKLITYIGRSKYLFYSLMAVMGLITLLNLAAPSLQQRAIDNIQVKNGKTIVTMSGLLKNLAALGVVYLLSSVMTYVQAILSAKLSQYTVRTMRSDLFGDLVRLPIKYLDTHRHGDLMSRMTNDVENISTTIAQSIGSLISSVLTVIGSLVIMLLYSRILTLISLSTIFLTIFVSGYLTKYMKKYFVKQQVLLGTLNGHVEEMVVGYKTVVAYGKEKDSVDTFRKMSDDLKKTAVKAQIFGGVMGPCMNIISNIGFILIAAFGGWLAIKDVITIGTIQAFLLYSKQFSRPINEIANQYANIQTAIAGAERIFDVMEADKEPDQGRQEFSVPDVKGDLSFKDIKFSYDQKKPVLKDFDLEVRAGQKIAIVGATGSGKTTVVNLLTRFYEIDGGSITIDGVSIYDIPLEKLRQTIAIVLQDTVLFSGTIEDNIRYGREDATSEEVRQAAELANADEFIRLLPEGYDTPLSEGGSNLSQGQRQLLTIARAVLADPKILILDEATSSVDTRTEMNIQSAMVSLMKDRTSLIIAHRLSTIRDADKIVVIDKGVVAECGSHEELIKDQGAYYDLYRSQFSGVKT